MVRCTRRPIGPMEVPGLADGVEPCRRPHDRSSAPAFLMTAGWADWVDDDLARSWRPAPGAFGEAVERCENWARRISPVASATGDLLQRPDFDELGDRRLGSHRRDIQLALHERVVEHRVLEDGVECSPDV